MKFKYITKTLCTGLLMVVFCSASLMGEINYNDYFKNSALRLDLIIAGNAVSQSVYLKEATKEKIWGGRRANLDRFHGKGYYKFNIHDLKTGKLIYTDGFSTLFMEWQTTNEAKKMERSFEHVVHLPMPKRDIVFKVIGRVQGEFTDTLLSVVLALDGQFIKPVEEPLARTKSILRNGKPEACIDIVLIAEGYTKKEEREFYRDAQLFSEGLFTSAPFHDNKAKFNISAVMAYSVESGADDPHASVYVNSALGASYNTLYSDRYLMTTEVSKLYNYAALVPYDQIIILVNSEKYGGGGIFNFYSISATRGRKNMEVFIHELGHSFAGLADEYYTSDVSYTDYYPLNIEPWEPNITTLVRFETKWKSMIASTTPVPTPDKPKFRGHVGLYEGGGYMANGVYRPCFDCRMKSNDAKDFCPVCSLEVVKTMRFYNGD